MNCRNCKKPIDPDDKYCRHCGTQNQKLMVRSGDINFILESPVSAVLLVFVIALGVWGIVSDSVSDKRILVVFIVLLIAAIVYIEMRLENKN